MRWAWVVIAACGVAVAGDEARLVGGEPDGRPNSPKPIERPFTQRDLAEMQRRLWRVRTGWTPMRLPRAPRPLRTLGPAGVPLPAGAAGAEGQVPPEAPAPDANAPQAGSPQGNAPLGAEPGVDARDPSKRGPLPLVDKRPAPPPRPKR